MTETVMRKVSGLNTKLIEAAAYDGGDYTLYFNSEDISAETVRARVGLVPGQEIFGWVDRIQKDADGNYQMYVRRDGRSAPLTRREYGQVRWEYCC